MKRFLGASQKYKPVSVKQMLHALHAAVSRGEKKGRLAEQEAVRIFL